MKVGRDEVSENVRDRVSKNVSYKSCCTLRGTDYGGLIFDLKGSFQGYIKVNIVLLNENLYF